MVTEWESARTVLPLSFSGVVARVSVDSRLEYKELSGPELRSADPLDAHGPTESSIERRMDRWPCVPPRPRQSARTAWTGCHFASPLLLETDSVASQDGRKIHILSNGSFYTNERDLELRKRIGAPNGFDDHGIRFVGRSRRNVGKP